MSGAEELPWMMLAFMGGIIFIIALAKLFLWLLPKIFPELKS